MSTAHPDVAAPGNRHPAQRAIAQHPRPTSDPACHAYVCPRLAIYGGVGLITTKVGSRGMKDMSGNRRTGF
jgi:hypothetical protein